MTSGFVRGAQEALWEDGFKHFAALPPDSKGRRVVVQEHTSAEGFRVGAWLHTQRTLHRKGEFTPHPTPPSTPRRTVRTMVSTAFHKAPSSHRSSRAEAAGGVSLGSTRAHGALFSVPTRAVLIYSSG